MARLERAQPRPDYWPVYRLAIILTFLVISILALAMAMEPKIYLLGAA